MTPSYKYNRPTIGYSERSHVFIDEYMYASLLANKVRAEESIKANDIDKHYSKEGWTMLLLYYIDCIDAMIDTWPNSITYIDIIEYNKLLILESKTVINCHNHIMPVYDDLDICIYTIEAIKIMQTILDMECNIDYLKVEYLKLRNLEPCREYINKGKHKTKYITVRDGNNKQKHDKAKESWI